LLHRTIQAPLHSQVKYTLPIIHPIAAATVHGLVLVTSAAPTSSSQTIKDKATLQHFRKRASSMAFSPPEGGSISTLINPTQGDEQFSVVDEQKEFWGKPVYHTFRVDFDPLSRKGQREYNKFESAGILCCHTLTVWSYYRVDTIPSCYVLPRCSKNVIRKHTYIKGSHDVARSDESNNLFRHLCSEFYNVAQEFVACDEEAAILRAALWDAKSKLTDYRASMRSNTIAASQNTVPAQCTGGAIVHDIQGPSRVKTKGRPKGKRLRAELDKSIKKSMQKRKRKSHL
ncbi:hypothetical protein S245_062646, partial [Arachis hypogaea]